jgi:hypothetical protein
MIGMLWEILMCVEPTPTRRRRVLPFALLVVRVGSECAGLDYSSIDRRNDFSWTGAEYI